MCTFWCLRWILLYPQAHFGAISYDCYYFRGMNGAWAFGYCKYDSGGGIHVCGGHILAFMRSDTTQI
jgi:hypothetical protein